MLETEELRNEVVIDNAEEVNFLVVPEEVYEGELETSNDLSGVLIGAAVAATAVAAYKFGPKVLGKVKKMLKKESDETLEEKQTRLLEELAKVNEKIKTNVEDAQPEE